MTPRTYGGQIAQSFAAFLILIAASAGLWTLAASLGAR